MKYTDEDVVKTCGVVCGDNRFELIKKFKKKLFEQTNIETAKDEVAVIDSILFRLWQMGWLDKLEDYNRQKAEIEWLEEENRGLRKICDRALKTYKATKAEAIKEFDKKFKEKSSSVVTSCQGKEIYETKQYQISAVNFDNLVKEMVGDEE